MNEKEVVLKLGIEGGGITVFRRPIESGAWEFQAKSSSMNLDENDDEAWSHHESQHFPSIEDALRSVVTDSSWVLHLPMEVHADYRQSLWDSVQEIARRLPDDRQESWNRRRKNWQRRCAVTP